MYADDWRKAAVAYSEWAVTRQYPVPENIFTPPAPWGKRSPRPEPPPALAPPVKTCVHPKCREDVFLYPYSLGRCKTHWKEELRKRAILRGIERRARKREGLTGARDV